MSLTCLYDKETEKPLSVFMFIVQDKPEALFLHDIK